MRRLFLLLVLIMLCTAVRSEGTKELRPDSTYFGCVQINDWQRPFAMQTNTNPLYRLYFRIKDFNTERVYLGLRHITSGSETATFRIKDPNGNIVRANASMPTSAQAGYIKYYANAVAGPKIGGLPANGYTPIVFTPAMNGDFYIEFTTSYQGTNTAYHLDYFDLTVATSTANRIKGRLWSYAWDLNTKAQNNRNWAKFYAYTDDGYVNEFNMNGVQPFGFIVACNNSGPGNSGIIEEDRKSIPALHGVGYLSVRPQYKIFLNDPDITCFPSGTLPTIIENIDLIGTPTVGNPVYFKLNMSKAGTCELILDLNGTSGYQPNTTDVILAQTVNAGVDTVVWDGKDGLGNDVDPSQIVIASASFYTGVTHFPFFDPEIFDRGIIVNKVRPIAELAKVYWDDTNFPDGGYNFVGASPGHTWTFHEERTYNTWWDGFRIDNMKTFQFQVGPGTMPVELLSFSADVNGKIVELKWSTAAEINNNYFVVERKTSSTDYEEVFTVSGSGNSNSLKEYEGADINPLNGPSFYRLKQVDFDGKTEYFNPVYVNVNLDDVSYSVYPNPVNSNNAEVSIAKSVKGNTEVSVYDQNGEQMFFRNYCDENDCVIKVNFDEFKNGTYILYVKTGTKEFKSKIVKRD